MRDMTLPEDFIRETRLLMGEARFDRFIGAFDEEAPVSIRLNPLKMWKVESGKWKVESGRWKEESGMWKEERGKWKENTPATDSARESNLFPLSSFHFPQKKVPWCPEGFYLSDRPQFTFDPLFHAGCYYVQEAASMFITHILNWWNVERGKWQENSPATDSAPESNLFPLSTFHFPPISAPISALDMCAAPGGKSTAMRTVLPEGSVLVSNEPIPTRAQILLENITKWGWPDCIVTNNYPRDFRKAKVHFDLILCDVPCSGEGMFRKDPATISEWSLQNVEKCWRLQREIVADAWECLNPGGILIYSTCTFNTKENEENVRWILDTYDAEPVTIPTDPSWNITGSLLPGFDVPVYRFIPGITRSEGLFICVLRKAGSPKLEAESWKPEAGSRKVEAGSLKPEGGGWKVEGGGRKLPPQKDHPQKVQPQKILSQMSGLNVISSPPKLGGARGGLNQRQTNPSFRPPLTPPDSGVESPRVDLSYQDALKYLRGESLVLPPDTPRGIVTVTYLDVPLGPVKNIGPRANNLYPKPWRIKSTHLPTAPVVIICTLEPCSLATEGTQEL